MEHKKVRLGVYLRSSGELATITLEDNRFKDIARVNIKTGFWIINRYRLPEHLYQIEQWEYLGEL